jgi:hypothetical protein
MAPPSLAANPPGLKGQMDFAYARRKTRPRALQQ